MNRPFTLEVDDPASAAAALADMQGSVAYPLADGSWIVAADDGRGATFEVYPRPLTLEAEAQPGVVTVATPWSEAAVFAIAAASGAHAEIRRRGLYRVIEVCIEGRVLIEVLTDEMQEEFRLAATPPGWRVSLRKAA